MNPGALSAPPVVPQLYKPPAVGEPPSAAWVVAGTVAVAHVAPAPSPAAEALQPAGSEAVTELPMELKFCVVTEPELIKFCAERLVEKANAVATKIKWGSFLMVSSKLFWMLKKSLLLKVMKIAKAVDMYADCLNLFFSVAFLKQW